MMLYYETLLLNGQKRFVFINKYWSDLCLRVITYKLPESTTVSMSSKHFIDGNYSIGHHHSLWYAHFRLTWRCHEKLNIAQC